MSSRSLARQAIKDWLDAGEILYLDKVFVAPPLRLSFPQYSQNDHHNCQIVVFIDDQGEMRMSLGGANSGKKRIDYMIALEIYYRCTLPDPETAQDVFDDLVDAINARLRADRRLGVSDSLNSESVIWQAGEGGYGIQIDFKDPADGNIGGEPIEHYARMRFEVTQWITA